ncbi:MAG: protein kinase [Egibacteraceae bacterium]
MDIQVLAERYELRGILGTGGMARVYEGYDRTLARRVAVKVLRDDIGGGRELRERMLREARAAASFHHPNAVAVFDTGQEGRTPYIVMELVEGRTLADEIAHHGSLDAARTVTIAVQVLSALAAAHRRGLVHRDVKPANIMLPPGNGAKLTDFGIAKGLEELSDLTVDGEVLGTPKYLSPEQVSGSPATPRSDVYAMGVVLYEMLAGQPPFTGDNAFAVARAHQEDAPPRLDRRVKGLDASLVGVVNRCLEKDPSRRYADADDLLKALSGKARVSAAVATTAAPPRRDRDRPAPAARPAAPPAAGRSGRGFGLAAALVVLLALAAVLVVQSLIDSAPDAPVDEPADAPVEAPVEPTAEPDPAQDPPPNEPGPEADERPDPPPDGPGQPDPGQQPADPADE